MSNVLDRLAIAYRQKMPIGIFSVCSAHPWVLEAAVEQACQDGSDLLIEATSNQVNHQGGYTGMRPEDFRRLVEEIAERKGLPSSRLILGGDHLGPNPWRHLAAAAAMEEAGQMVQAYVRAGFQKIHLDASMACAGEAAPLSDETIAERAAMLCSIAEEASGPHKPVYVIGTEVPVPGGATESLAELEVTRREAAARTLEIHREVFSRRGLEAAWPRVIALVVQPGVEFNHDTVVNYEPRRAASLSALLQEVPNIVYEAHSTDYQPPRAYSDLVRDGFAILKVGPALTFAMREALMALTCIETELLPAERCSNLLSVLERVMLSDPRYWKGHYHGSDRACHLLRFYSYSDRVRYYWNDASVQQAVKTLIDNLESTPIPETMLSAWLPEQYAAVREGKLQPHPQELIRHRIRQVLEPYASACRPESAVGQLT